MRWLWVFLALAGLAAGQDDKAVIRERERLVAQALQTKDKAALRRLVDGEFRVDCQISGPTSTANSSLSVEDLLDGLAGARMQEYRASVKDLAVKPEYAVVSLNEEWVLALNGSQTPKHFQSMDTWVKRDGEWRLSRRMWVVFHGYEVAYP
jgi:hypothetical protein